MSMKRNIAAFIAGGLFGLLVYSITGFSGFTWQFWVITVSAASLRLTDLIDRDES